MLTNPEIEALNREFNSPASTMRVETYAALREEIRARPPQAREPAPAPVAAPAAPADRLVTMGVMLRNFGAAGRAIKAHVHNAIKPIVERQNYLETKRNLTMELFADYNRSFDKLFAEIEQMRCEFGGSPDLANRIKALEARPQMAYRGIWNSTDDYRSGDLVTDRGSLHYCWADVRGQRPGETDSWQLCQKRDAR